MTDLMLTADELERLTGRKRPKAQAAFCRRYGITHRVNECGEVIVARAIAERFLGVAPAPVEREPDLNWPALERHGILSRQ